MRLSDDALKCVVFLGHEQATKDGSKDIAPGGTGFLISHKHKTGESRAYLVTALHVAEMLDPTKVGVRLNSKDGGFKVHFAEIKKWENDPSSDIALCPFEVPDWADALTFDTKFFATSFKVESKNFGAGDLTYVVGLFKLLYGKQRNMPVVFGGHVALMAGDEELVLTNAAAKAQKKVKGYLVEAQAASGASGSPVFILRSIPYAVPDPNAKGNMLTASVHGSVWLFGLWSSSWGGLPADVLIEMGVPKDAKVPIGIGVVIPAEKILELVTGLDP